MFDFLYEALTFGQVERGRQRKGSDATAKAAENQDHTEYTSTLRCSLAQIDVDMDMNIREEILNAYLRSQVAQVIYTCFRIKFLEVMSEEVPAEIPVAEVAQVEKKKKKRRSPKESQSVFESQPAPSLADVGANKEFAAGDQGQSTFESQPSVSRADTSCTGAGIVAESDQSTFESNPAGSKADVTWTTEAATPGDGPSVFESTPQQHTAAVTYADAVTTEHSDVSVFESQPVKSSATTTYADTLSGGDTAPSVFESQPKQSAAHAKSGVEGDGESEYTTDDDEP